jgi:hypothetical protein
VLSRSVIVRTIRDKDGQTAGLVSSSRQIIAGSLAGDVWRIRGVAVLGEHAKNLDRRDVNEAEFFCTRTAPARPALERALEQHERALHVGRRKSPGSSIERSTWLSAARCSTASGPKSRNAAIMAAPSATSTLRKRWRPLNTSHILVADTLQSAARHRSPKRPPIPRTIHAYPAATRSFRFEAN